MKNLSLIILFLLGIAIAPSAKAIPYTTDTVSPSPSMTVSSPTPTPAPSPSVTPAQPEKTERPIVIEKPVVVDRPVPVAVPGQTKTIVVPGTNTVTHDRETVIKEAAPSVSPSSTATPSQTVVVENREDKYSLIRLLAAIAVVAILAVVVGNLLTKQEVYIAPPPVNRTTVVTPRTVEQPKVDDPDQL